jgi:hypothetical protein
MENFFPDPQLLWYCTLTLVLTEPTLPVVNPVVLPLFITDKPTVGVRVVLLIVAKSRMAPLESTAPLLT